MTREEAIAILEEVRAIDDSLYQFNKKYLEALDMALASLKTDEAYQLEYENRDFVEIPKGMTNGEVIQALFPNLNFTNVLAKMYAQNGKILLDWWNAPYQKGGK